MTDRFNNSAPALRPAIIPLLATMLLLARGSEAATDCEALGEGRKIGETVVLKAQLVSSGRFTRPAATPIDDLPAFCRVIARAAPSQESNVIIEVWLPVNEHWNGKILGTGNGGFGGAIQYPALAGGVKRGYATANTDLGTHPAASLPIGLDYAAGNGRGEVVKDWGHRATHAMALLTKELVRRYYGKRAKRAYFVGCSTGGHQGLTEAQRYPDDYDAILAGAPGHNRTHLHAMFADLTLKMQRSGSSFSREQLDLWRDAIMNACVGKDGGSPQDEFLTDPTQCDFSPRTLQCSGNETPTACLTHGQVGVLEALYDGTRNPRTGELIYPPVVRGTESMLALFGLTDPDIDKRPVPDHLHRWVFGPEWDAASFDFDRDMRRVDEELGPHINAMKPDLSDFANRGGKLILFHGWADLINPIDTIVYYDRVHEANPNASSFLRLFMAPGVGHCTGGSGPDTFGQTPEMPASPRETDLLKALDHWVETDEAPDKVIARKLPLGELHETDNAADAEPVATRPVCAYPSVAKYDGIGDPNHADSFSCSVAPGASYERPAKQYLQ